MKVIVTALSLPLVVFVFLAPLNAQEEKPLAPGWLSLDGSVGLVDRAIADGKSRLEKAVGIGIGAYLDVGYNYSSNRPRRPANISLRSFDQDHNRVVFNNFNITLDKPEADWGVGFHVAGDFGRSAQILREATFWRRELGKEPQAELREAFLTTTFPVGAGLQMKGGFFVTTLGTEILPNPGEYNDNILLNNDDKRSDFVTGFTPGITLAVERATYRLLAGYNFTAEIYSKEENEARNDAFSRHNLTLLLGQEANRNTGRFIEGGMSNLFSTVEDSRYLQDALGDASTKTVNSRGGTSALLSFFGKADYNFANRYFLSFTLRRDGSSRLGPSNRWGTFPAVGVGWRLSEEPFMAGKGPFSNLMLRFGWGITGNQLIPSGRILSQFGGDRANTYYDIGGSNTTIAAGFRQTSVGNPDLKWETQRQFNAGLDLGMLHDRLMLTLDAYHSVTRDLLLWTDLPRTSGFTSQLRNLGSVRNRGWELSLSTLNISTPSVTWRSTLNLSANRNRVLDLGGVDFIFPGASRYGWFIDGYESFIVKVGEPLGSIYGYQVNGLWQQGDTCYLTDPAGCTPGEYKIADLDGNQLTLRAKGVTVTLLDRKVAEASREAYQKVLAAAGDPGRQPRGGIDEDDSRGQCASVRIRCESIPGSLALIVCGGPGWRPEPEDMALLEGAAEQLRIVGRVVVHHQEDFAAQINPLEIVPLIFGRLHAIADENDLGIEADRFVLDAGPDDGIGQVFGGRDAPRMMELQGKGGRVGAHPDDRNGLEEAIADRLDAKKRQQTPQVVAEFDQVPHKEMMTDQLKERERQSIERHSHGSSKNVRKTVLGVAEGDASPQQSAADEKAALAAPRRHHFIDCGLVAPNEPMSQLHQATKRILVTGAPAEFRTENRIELEEDIAGDQHIPGPAFLPGHRETGGMLGTLVKPGFLHPSGRSWVVVRPNRSENA